LPAQTAAKAPSSEGLTPRRSDAAGASALDRAEAPDRRSWSLLLRTARSLVS
jgi:hypothetical protein